MASRSIHENASIVLATCLATIVAGCGGRKPPPPTDTQQLWHTLVTIAQRQMERGDEPRALSALDDAEAIADRAADTELRARVSYRRAITLARLDRLDAALDELHAITLLAGVSADLQHLASVLRVRLLYEGNRGAEALEALERIDAGATNDARSTELCFVGALVRGLPADQAGCNLSGVQRASLNARAFEALGRAEEAGDAWVTAAEVDDLRIRSSRLFRAARSYAEAGRDADAAALAFTAGRAFDQMRLSEARAVEAHELALGAAERLGADAVVEEIREALAEARKRARGTEELR